jgi:hypothetical protein
VRRLVLVVGLVFAAGACTSSGGDSASEDLLYLDDGSELAAVMAGTGEVAFRVPGAVTTPDFSRVFRAVDGPGNTVLSAIDTTKGESTWTRYVDAGLEPRVAATDESVVLMPRRAQPGSGPYRPEGRATTTMVIVRPQGEAQRLELAGNYEPEAFSTDGKALFLVEYRPPMHPEVYSVRQLDLTTQAITPVPSPDKDLQEDMRGTARTQAMAPDGTRLYTLYTLELPHADGTVDRHAFVHVLDLRERWAHCVDLPVAFATTSETAGALAVSPDGDRLFVANRKAGKLAEIDTRVPALTRTVPMELAPDETLTAVATGDGLVLGTGRRVLRLDEDLVVRRTWAVDQMVTGLQPSRQGRHLYVGQSGRIVVLDTRNGSESVIPVSAPGRLRSVGRGLGALANGSNAQCAC